MRYVLLLWLWGAIILGCTELDRDRCLDRGGQWDEASQQCVEQHTADSSLVEKDSTRYYTYHINYPSLNRTDSLIRNKTRAFAREHKQQFLSLFERDSMPRSASYPWEFRLDYSIQDSAKSFVSILGNGYAFSGGAHGNHFFTTINLDRRSDRLLQLQDLLADSAALAPISQFVQRELTKKLLTQFDTQDDKQAIAANKERIRQWVEEGTVPNPKNYQYFWLAEPVNGHPTGITFLFPPYQVAPYAAGEQRIFVPASVFADRLNIRYRDWFGVQY